MVVQWESAMWSFGGFVDHSSLGNAPRGDHSCLCKWEKKCLYIFIIYIDMYYIYILCLLLLLLSFLMSDYASLVLF